MKNDDLEQLFQSLDFDVAEPSGNHQERFRQKLEKRSRGKLNRSGVISILNPIMAVAASFLLGFVLFQTILNDPLGQKGELASVSAEMETTQNFYVSLIEQELTNLKAKKSPETETLIRDALRQMEILETEYNKLKKDLIKSGEDKRVIHAMISNFQQRIDLLNHVLEKANTIHQIKHTPHEDNLL